MSTMKSFLLDKFRIIFRGYPNISKLKKQGCAIGNNFNVQEGVIIDKSHCFLIKIGDNVTLAPRVHILAHDASTKRYLGVTKIGHVHIGNNVFIGAGSIVLPNTIIGDNVVIGAGSIVTTDVEENSVYCGNPAKKICSLDDYKNKMTSLIKKRPCYDYSYTIKAKVDRLKKNQMISDLEDGIGFIE